MVVRVFIVTLIFSLFLHPLTAFNAKEAPVRPDMQDQWTEKRHAMVQTQILSRGIEDLSVISAMETVPRHEFIPETGRGMAYADRPVLIGEGQTISQPYVVALMTELMELDGSERVLEIGTGSGYQAAVLAHTAAEVFSIEIKPVLHAKASAVLTSLGYSSIQTKNDDGYFGWEEHAPYDGIMITAAANHVPPPLLDQLVERGYLVMPLGDPFGFQQLIRVTKLKDDYTVEHITGVMFVPMTGNALDTD